VTSTRHKQAYFVLEGMNSLATTYYGYYLFFYLKEAFGFGNLENLAAAALYGLLYTVAAWWCGRFAQKFGYFRALKTGFCAMALSLTAGFFLGKAWEQILVMLGWTIGMCFTWPTLEALVSEGAPPRELQRLIGIYNLVWSGAAAMAYFAGGAMIERFGLRSLFYLPVIIHVGQLVFLRWVETRQGRWLEETDQVITQRRKGAETQRWEGKRTAETVQGKLERGEEREAGRGEGPDAEGRPTGGSAAGPKVFLKLAWIGNPFAYVAINTILPVIPALAQQLHLSKARAGVFCSVWLFARLGSFALLWRWTGWRYRFRWFLAAYVAIIGAFLAILLVPNLGVMIAAQLLFGAAVGLVYYSSLYYSMDVGETKGEHGGFHESALGAGQCVGPAVGALALAAGPGARNIGTWAVGLLLGAGLIAILVVRWLAQGGKRPKPE
jgi:MFS family permease